MNFSPITFNDLEELRALQPADWPDIITDIEKYINWSFCFPFKLTVDNRIVGTGTSIVFEKTGWLAHIIVHPDFRNKGYGLMIVNQLINHQKSQNVASTLLIATQLGFKVYQKVGFRTVDKYVFLKRESAWSEYPVSSNIIKYSEKYKQSVFELDQLISGEDRKILLSSFLPDSYLYINNNNVEGFYIPGLKEGLIVAITETAGIELMKLKYAKVDKAVIPAENIAGITFLKQNSFTETSTTGTRMILGKDIPWQPKMIYSRIAGNLG